jgi:hypothetical protein
MWEAGHARKKYSSKEVLRYFYEPQRLLDAAFAPRFPRERALEGPYQGGWKHPLCVLLRLRILPGPRFGLRAWSSGYLQLGHRRGRQRS